jgi:serine/threonine protein kinase
MQSIPKNSCQKNPYISPQLPIGKENTVLGSGTITRILGTGGMASVYEIWNQQLEVYHAVKLMHPNCSVEALQRFQTEIKISAKLHHPNIIEIHGVGEWNSLPYIEMEKAEGLTLESLIAQRGALPVEVVISIGLLVTRALNYAHNHEYMLYNSSYHGIIHRDLKPGNIMVSKHEYVKLMDFGIARPADASFHTVDGTVLGTLQYLSPEQLEGKSLDIRTDIYSLGACLYEAACGNFAFPELNITRLLSDKAKNRYRPLKDYSRKFPVKFIKIIHQCMHHDRNIRPQTASVLGEELETLLKRMTTTSPEEIIACYMESDPTRITVVPLHHLSKRAVFSAIVLICIGVLGMFFTLSINHYQEAVSKSPSLKNSRDSTILSVADSVSQKPVIFSITESSQALKIIADVESSKALSHNKRSNALEFLYQKHATRDLMQIMKNELNAGSFTNALLVYDSMPPYLSSTIPATILKIRVLSNLNSKSLPTFLKTVSTREAEILLAKARNAWQLGNITASEQFLSLAESSQREFISYENLIQECYYLRAQCATGRFDQNPDEQNWKKAIEAWYNVKKELRSQPSHAYFKSADNEIARIGAKFRSAAR